MSYETFSFESAYKTRRLPTNSPMIRSTYNSYVHLLKVAPKFWNSNFSTRLESMSDEKKVYHLSSIQEMDKCLEDLQKMNAV